ncbi:MAG: hypothetical protein ABIT71_15135 [Vicinamibacteraceae bacterium]
MRRILMSLAVLLGAAVAASAATVPYRSDLELVAISDRVVRARVIDSVVERAPSGAIRTRTRIAVIEDFTGGLDPTLVVLERGGRLPDGSGVWIPGAPRFVQGDDVVLCLERTAGGYRTVSMGFSAFRVGAVVSGDRPLTRFGGPAVVGPALAGPALVGNGVTSIAETGRGLGAFRRAVATMKGVSTRAVLTEAQAGAAVTTAGRLEAPFTLLGDGVRWQQADAGQAVTWFRNTVTPSPIEGADTDEQIRLALAGWTEPPSASITLAFGGTRPVSIEQPADPTADPYCTAGNLGVGLITFGDPLDELPIGVLAIGGGCASAATHMVNGETFNAFTHGLVVLNDAASMAGYTTAPNITRILEHEVGHGIGLGHSDAGQDNVMYPSCCSASMPVPPAIGPDDLAGLGFLYPPCVYTLSSPSDPSASIGEQDSLTLTVSMPSCPWTVTTDAIWLTVVSPRTGSGSTLVRYRVTPNLATVSPRSATLRVGPTVATIAQQGDVPIGGGLFAGWAQFFGLHPESGLPGDAPTGDPDGDGVSNLDEQAAGTHPRGTVRRYLAEGAANAFFDTEVALFNPAPLDQDATVVLRVQPETGAEASWPVGVYGGARATVASDVFRSLTGAPFSTLIESDRPVVADRTMRWDAGGYGAHAETSVEAPSTTWYLAEGSTSGQFSLFYLLQNPGPTAALATIRFLRPAPMAPVTRQYAIAPHARLTVPIDTTAPELANTDVSGVVTASQPIVVERAMYLNRPGQPFAAGHESAGVTAPSTEWFLAEGATGSFFDLFVLIANPGVQPALVRVDYLLPGGGTLTKDYAIAGESRFTIYVDDEQLPAGSGQRPLASTAVAMRVRSVNGTPILVERSMWWPQPLWYEAHNAPGTTATGTRWALAAGETGGPTGTETYILIANTGLAAGTARLTLHAETGDMFVRDVTLPAGSRTNVAVSTAFPEVAGVRFATLVESLGASPAPIVVERAMYDNAGGVLWSAGTAAVATRLTP